ERALLVLEVIEDSHTRGDELLERAHRRDHLASETALLRHDEHLERRPRFQCVHQPQESGPVRELRAADAVIDVDVLVGNNPTLPSGVRVAVLHLPGDGFLLVGDAGLLRALACVDGGDYRDAFHLSASFWRCLLAKSAWVPDTLVSPNCS